MANRCSCQVNRVLSDLLLVIQRGNDVDRRIGDDDGPVEAGHVQDKSVANASLGTQAGRSSHHCAHQFVGVQASLHQHLDFGFPGQSHRFVGGSMAMRRVHQFEAGDIKAELVSRRFDLSSRSYQDRLQNTQLGGLDRASEGTFVTGMGHGRRHWSQRLTPGNEGFVLFVLAVHVKNAFVTSYRANQLIAAWRSEQRSCLAWQPPPTAILRSTALPPQRRPSEFPGSRSPIRGEVFRC